MPTTAHAKPAPVLNHEPEAVVYARLAAGYNSMTAAAEAITEQGVKTSLQLLNDIEKGRRSATAERLQAMARAYNCPIVVLQRKRWAA